MENMQDTTSQSRLFLIFNKTRKRVLNPSPTEETDDTQTNSPSSIGRKQTTDGRRQTGLICRHGIGGDNISLMAEFI